MPIEPIQQVNLGKRHWPKFLAYDYGDSVQIVAAGQWLKKLGRIVSFEIDARGLVKFGVKLIDGSVYNFHPVELKRY